MLCRLRLIIPESLPFSLAPMAACKSKIVLRRSLRVIKNSVPGRAFKVRMVRLNLPFLSSSPTLPANTCSPSAFKSARLLLACATRVNVWLIAERGTSNLNTFMLSPPHA